MPAKRATAYVTYVALRSQSNPSILQANPTLAAGDVKVAIDDAAPANVTTLPVVDADFTKRLKVSLSAAEMTGDNISLQFSDVSGGEWCDHFVNIQTTQIQLDDVIPTITPITTTIGSRVTSSEIELFYQENGWSVGPNAVVDADGEAVDISGYATLKFIIEAEDRTDVLTSTDVTVSGDDDNQWTVTESGAEALAVTGTAPNSLKWSLRGLGTNLDVLLGFGGVHVIYAPAADS